MLLGSEIWGRVYNKVGVIRLGYLLSRVPFTMAGIPLDKAELFALLLETLFYGATSADSRREAVQGLIAANYRSGIFLTLFILLVVMSFVEREIRIANQCFILPVAALMMVLATAVGILVD